LNLRMSSRALKSRENPERSGVHLKAAGHEYDMTGWKRYGQADDLHPTTLAFIKDWAGMMKI